MTRLTDLIDGDGVFVDGDWVESKDQDPNGEVRLVQLADIGERVFLDKSARFLTASKAKELRCTFLKPSDILIARMPDPIGRACMFPDNQGPSVTVVDVCIVRPSKSRVEPRWLLHMINSAIFKEKFAGWIVGTTRQRISRGNLSKIEFDLPSFDEQRRVAEILDKADELRRKRRRALELIDGLSRSIYLERFGAQQGRGTTLGALCEDVESWNPSRHPDKPAFPYIDISSIDQSAKTITEHKVVTPLEAPSRARQIVKSGDVLISTVRPNLNAVAVVPPELDGATASTGFCVLRPKAQKNASEFIFAVARSTSFVRAMIEQATGASYPAVSDKIVKSFVAPKASEVEIGAFSTTLRRIMKASCTAQKASSISGSLFYSLQHRAFAAQL